MDKETYQATLLENVEFTKSELLRMNVVFIDGLDDLDRGLGLLGVELTGNNLNKNGYALTKVGQVDDSFWAIHSNSESPDVINDIWERKNFYDISKVKGNEKIKLFEKVHLRDDSLEEDLSYYINIDTYMSSEHHSEYVH